MKELTAPALFQSTEIDQLAYEIKTAIEAAERHQAQGAARFAEAGQKLLQAKAKIPHGKWAEWLEKNAPGRSLQSIRRWMLLAKRSSTSDLEDQWAIICGNRDDELPQDEETESDGRKSATKQSANSANSPSKSSPQQPPLCMRCIKNGKRDPNCQKCKDMEESATEQPKPPEPTFAEQVKKRAESFEAIAFPVFQTRLDYQRCQAAKERFRLMADWIVKLADEKPRPPSKGKCKTCKAEITWAVTENNAMIPLDEADRGNYEIVDGIARQVTGFSGKFRHHFVCTKGKQEMF